MLYEKNFKGINNIKFKKGPNMKNKCENNMRI